MTLFSAGYGVVMFLASTGVLSAGGAQFSQDGQFLIAGSRAVRVWETRTGRLACGIETRNLGSNLVSGVGISPDGSRFAIGTEGGKILLLQREGCVRRGELQGPKGSVDFLVFSPNGKYLYAASAFEQWLYSIDFEGAKILRHFRTQQAVTHDLHLSPDGAILAVVGIEGAGLSLWDTSTGKEIWFNPYDVLTSGVGFRSNRSLLVTNGSAITDLVLGRGSFSSPESSPEVTWRRFFALNHAARSLAVTRDGRILITKSFGIDEPSEIAGWDLEHDGLIFNIKSSGNSRIIVHPEGTMALIHRGKLGENLELLDLMRQKSVSQRPIDRDGSFAALGSIKPLTTLPVVSGGAKIYQ